MAQSQSVSRLHKNASVVFVIGFDMNSLYKNDFHNV
jgi:hypothetical protein